MLLWRNAAALPRRLRVYAKPAYISSQAVRQLCSHSHDHHAAENAEGQAQLRMLNSLTKSKTVIGSNRPLKWYNCGPTVYDAAHIGHARNYVTQDVLRRIITDFFGMDVNYVMNITDIDDKIIERTRQDFFIQKFTQEHQHLTPVLISLINEYLDQHTAFAESMKENEKYAMYVAAGERCRAALQNARSTLETGGAEESSAKSLIEASKDILGPALNERFRTAQIAPELYTKLASRWEADFFSDMARLNVLPPDTITRVRDHMPEIVSFVEGIVKNGYGYVVDGSVYFDTHAFDQAPGHKYGKLITWQEEGSTNTVATPGTKKSPSDFALWKAAKPGEPSWDSPWGPGRPGWHIECSAMASAVLGNKLDIHSGGVDLMFPHHTNELAQSEAYFNTGSWVDCFIHTGHLHIEGMKMSKSLKNFITIKEILGRYTPDQLRLAFLLHPWHSKMDFSEDFMLHDVGQLESTLINFFARTKSLAYDAQSGSNSNPQRFESSESEIRAKFDHAKEDFKTALQSSIDTVAAINAIRVLVSQTNSYMDSRGPLTNVALIGSISRWVTKMFQLFGFQSLGEPGGTTRGAEKEDREQTVMPYIKALAVFRDEVRRLAKENAGPASKDILMLCDRLRDGVLPPLDVCLEDRPDGHALVKLVPFKHITIPKSKPSPQQKERKPSKHVDAEKRNTTSPHEMFRPPHVSADAYGSWDDNGVPLTKGDGEELSKNRRKKLQKIWDAQMKRYKQHQETL